MSLDLSMDPSSSDDNASESRSGGHSSRPGVHSSRPDWTIENADVETSTITSAPLRWSRRILRLLFRTLIAPIRGYLSLRRSMTIASVTLLLAAFMTLNVIWGFPWSGMMGGCLAMLVVGFTINRVMRPLLKVSVSLPRSAVAGHPFSVNVRLSNPRVFPAMKLRVGWHREGVREIYRQNLPQHWDASQSVSVDMLRSGAQMQWHGAMRFDRRGIHDLPPFQVASTFPFHLFHYRRSVGTETKIAITPAPANGDDDPTSRVMLAAIGEWAKQLVAGAPVEYVGNREYEVGVPVRRWDFASWARLGRPIVREYQSPSIQSVALIVDTSQAAIKSEATSRANAKQQKVEAEALFERLMSIAATAIADLSSRRIELNLYLTSESDTDLPIHRGAARSSEGGELKLVRLAAAKPIDPGVAEERIREAIEACGSRPVMIFSVFDLDSEYRTSLAGDLPPNVTYFPIKPSRHADVGDSE